MSDDNARAANLTLKLEADSGFTSETSVRVSPDQWMRINQIISEQPCELVPDTEAE